MPFQELALREWNAAENPKCRKFARDTQFNSTTLLLLGAIDRVNADVRKITRTDGSLPPGSPSAGSRSRRRA